MDQLMTGQLALVTGGSGGIGGAVAEKLASGGALVAVHYFRNQKEAVETVRRIHEAGGQAAAFQADLSDVRQIDSLVEEVHRTFGAFISVLINNAGQMSHRSSITEVTEQSYTQMMDINFKSCVFLSKAILPYMVEKRKGAIVNIASLAAHNGGGSGVAMYAAAKSAMLAFTKNAAKEFAGKGIRVNAVTPGVIANTSNDRFKNEEIRKSIISAIPLGREGLPEEVANAVLFLASEVSGFITGESLEVNGGMYMR